MRLTTYTKNGKKHCVLLPEDTAGGAVVNPEYGVPADPPDIESMDWDAIKREMHNTLVDNGLTNWLDVQQSQVGFQSALSVVKRYLIRLYRDQDKVT